MNFEFSSSQNLKDESVFDYFVQNDSFLGIEVRSLSNVFVNYGLISDYSSLEFYRISYDYAYESLEDRVLDRPELHEPQIRFTLFGRRLFEADNTYTYYSLMTRDITPECIRAGLNCEGHFEDIIEIDPSIFASSYESFSIEINFLFRDTVFFSASEEFVTPDGTIPRIDHSEMMLAFSNFSIENNLQTSDTEASPIPEPSTIMFLTAFSAIAITFRYSKSSK